MSPAIPPPENTLKVLLVDDDPVTRLVLATSVRRLGHGVVASERGQAVAVFARERPDMVLIDVLPPATDGHRLTAEIRAIAGERWVPILFVTTAVELAIQVKTPGPGADDYLVMPVPEAVLRAKLEVMRRMIGLHRRLEENNHELQIYHDAAEQEMRVVKDMLARLVHHEHLSDPMLEHWILPAATFSGDLVAAARTPAGALHVMLADGAGHGLAAALNVLPITPCFYTMTAKGLDIELITATLNRTIRQHLPVDRFVAATLLAVDGAARRVKIWNGGNPPLLALNADGEVFARFPSRNLALGILPPEAFAAAPEVFDYTQPCQLFAYSDGVVEGFDAATEGGGQAAVEGLMRGVLPTVRMKLLRNRVVARHAEHRAQDDMTLLLVRCDAVAGAAPAADAGASPVPPASARKFEVTLGPAELRELDVVPMLLDLIMTIPAAGDHRHELSVVLCELYSNALDHGVLGIESSLKEQGDGLECYMAARAAALRDLRDGGIVIRIEARDDHGLPALRITVRDSGTGFNFASFHPAPAVPAAPEGRPHGRGIALLSALCAGVEYRGSGNEVSICYRLKAPAQPIACAA